MSGRSVTEICGKAVHLNDKALNRVFDVHIAVRQVGLTIGFYLAILGVLYKIYVFFILDFIVVLKRNSEVHFSGRRKVETDAKYDYPMLTQPVEAHVAAESMNLAAEQASKAPPDSAQATATAPGLSP